MKKRIICLLMGLSLFCSAACNELVYAQEVEVDETNIVSTEEPEELEEPSENIQETYELILESVDEIYEVGDVISITPILKRHYMEDGVETEEVVENDLLTYEMNYDTNKIELMENEDTAGYDFVRKSPEAIEITVTASMTDAVGETKTIEQLYQMEPLDYQISFENLREEDSTWLYVDEIQYALEINTDNLKDKENAKIVWEVSDKKTGEILPIEFEQNDTEDALFLNGEILNTEGFGGKTISVKAKVISGGIDTNSYVQTDVVIRKTTAQLKTSIQGTYQLGKEWEYKTTVKAFLQNGSYPGGKNVSTTVENIKSSNTKVLKVIYDKNEKIWTLKSLKTGSAKVTFYLSKNGKEYKVTQKITITCSHPTTVESLQLEKIMNQAKEWLGRKESDGSHKLIIDIYNSHEPLAINYKVQYYDSWCATYVSAVAIKTGYTTLIPTECGCERMISLFKQRGEWKEDENCTPKQGWIIFYDWGDNGKGDNKGWSDHVGIVEKVSGKKITVIEGNYDNKVKRRTIDVNGRYIRGYAVPAYGKEIKRATISKNGLIEEGCTLCEEGKKTTIYAASKISLVKSDYTYNGKTMSPEISVKNSKGNKISKNEYTVSGSTSKKDVGKYSITVTLNGKKYTGTKKLYYTIYPQTPTGVKAVLNGGYNDVKVSWNNCSGAAGYNVYYKKSNASEYKKLISTTKTVYTKNNLSSGTKYTFKIVPYFINGNKQVESINVKTCTVYTLKKLNVPTVVKKAKNSVKISWNDISGESGYQISQSLRSGEVVIVSDSKETSVIKKTAAKKSYYYKVRAYKKVNGKMIYGPWSKAVKYKLVK